MRPLFWTPEFVSLGADVLIWRDARIEGITRHGDQRFSPAIVIGDRVSLQSRAHIVAADRIEIGPDTTLSLDVTILDSDHSHAAPGENVMEQPLLVLPVRIGANCFIGAGARILAGTRLGDGVIVGANAVVRGEFPSHCVIAGVPARIIKCFDFAAGTWAPVVQSER